MKLYHNPTFIGHEGVVIWKGSPEDGEAALEALEAAVQAGAEPLDCVLVRREGGFEVISCEEYDRAVKEALCATS